MEQNIAFPALGLEFTINRVAFTVLGKDIYWYGIIIAFGFLLAVAYAAWRIDEFGYNKDLLYDILIWALPCAIIGARLYYVIWEWDYYGQHPSEIIAVWKGGLAIYGGVIGALLAVAWNGVRRNLNIPGMFDVASLGLLIGQCIGRWGNFVNGEAHGAETSGIFGMTIDGAGPYQPTFLYESVWNFVGFWLIHFISKKNYRFRGQLFLSYVIWYGAGRAWIEGLRTDSLYIGSTGIRVSQVVAAVSCIVGVILLVLCLRRGVETLGQLVNPHADPRPIRTQENTEQKENQA